MGEPNETTSPLQKAACAHTHVLTEGTTLLLLSQGGRARTTTP